MRSAPFVALVLLATLALAFPTQAATQCWTTSPAQRIDTPASQAAPGHTYYVAVDSATSVWVYEEVNGLSGLQRDDGTHSDVANCQDGTFADRIIF